MKKGRAAESPFLDYELIEQIFSWLPVVAILRFRCVCKSLKSLISDPHFVQLHLERSVARNTGFTHHRLLIHVITHCHSQYYDALCCQVSSLLQPNPSFIERHRLKTKYQLVGPCNGLFCLRSQLTSKPYPCCVRLWNPATKLRSPKSPRLNYNGYYTDFGLGYDNLSHTYKVVAVSLGNISVYSMGANSWRSIRSLPAHLSVRQKQGGVYVRGALNWIAFHSENHLDTYLLKPSAPNNQVVIVSLDLGTEMNSRFLPPHGIDENLSYRHLALGVLKDHLCFYYDHNETHFVLWQMKEFGVEESWTCLMNVKYEYEAFPSRFHLQFPMCMSESDDVLILSHFNKRYHTILYNQRDGRLEQFESFREERWYLNKCYVESLVSPF